MRLARLAFLLALTVVFSALGTSSARAQAVRWEPSDADPAELILIFENCQPDGAPRLPAIEGTQADLTGQSREVNMVNFNTTVFIKLTYRLRTRSNNPVTIPSFVVKTDKGNLTVPSFTTAGAARNTTLESAASSQLSPATKTVWAGEVFPLLYVLDVTRRNFQQLETPPDWNSAPLITEDWTKPEPSERVVNGEAKLSIVYRTRAFAKTPGPLTLNGVTQIVRLQTGSIGFGLFSQPRLERLSVESSHPAMTIRALPAPAPANFSGAVGQFQLVSKVVPEKAGVGDPVTWTLELTGTGNWPDIPGLPQRDVSKDFQVVQPKAKRTPADGKLFDATLAEDVVLVPTKPGTYTLGPVNFSYFDPKTGTYQTVSAPRTTVTITAPATPQFNAPSNTGTPIRETGINPASEIRPPVSAPAAPAGIPRDPLPGSDTASAPLSNRTLGLLLLAPFIVPVALWGWLAVRRARATDPLRARREARTRLATTLAQLRTSPASGSQLLLHWQHDTAILCQLSHAAPPATALPDAAWSQLWLESDRALYSSSATLPSDWVARAEAALTEKKLPGFNPLRLFLPRNLFPFAAVLLLSLVTSPLALAADPVGGSAAYDGGKFAAAEKSWRDALAKNPTDWIAHHNLSLALAQQDKAGEAAAHAAAAFVQNPAHPSVRWHLGLAAEKAGAIPAPLAPFVRADLAHELARHHSPAQWQHLLIASVTLIALSLAALLAHAYGLRARAMFPVAIALLLLCITAALASFAAWQSYGLAADSRAAIVWRAGTLRSIPTEADTTQKTTPLAAGSLALVGRPLLGWNQITFENGQTGWVRKEELVPLWR
jgi:tetratricopeptide (TPR) repeat protein